MLLASKFKLAQATYRYTPSSRNLDAGQGLLVDYTMISLLFLHILNRYRALPITMVLILFAHERSNGLGTLILLYSFQSFYYGHVKNYGTDEIIS
jgi:hypothetical protein